MSKTIKEYAKEIVDLCREYSLNSALYNVDFPEDGVLQISIEEIRKNVDGYTNNDESLMHDILEELSGLGYEGIARDKVKIIDKWTSGGISLIMVSILTTPNNKITPMYLKERSKLLKMYQERLNGDKESTTSESDPWKPWLEDGKLVHEDDWFDSEEHPNQTVMKLDD